MTDAHEPAPVRPGHAAVEHTIRNHLDAVDIDGHVHVILVESIRHVRRTARGAVVQTGGDRFFLQATRQPLDLDPATARLRTRDGRQEFTFKIG